MRLVTDDEIKQIHLDMLVYFDRVCRENGIKYSITGGTLLGAIRHKGFIPWDDDVDVFLPRPEFEKLRRGLFPEDARYIWTDRRKNPEFVYNFGRLIDKRTVITDAYGFPSEGEGVFLDVCVVDGLPATQWKRNFHMKYMEYLHKARSSFIYNKDLPEYSSGNFIKRTAKNVFTSVTSLNFWLDRAEKANRKYSFDYSAYVANGVSQYGSKEIMHRASFDSYVDLEFEGHMFMACRGWKEYLTNVYGDYMQLPPVEKRIAEHIGSVYWKNEE